MDTMEHHLHAAEPMMMTPSPHDGSTNDGVPAAFIAARTPPQLEPKAAPKPFKPTARRGRPSKKVPGTTAASTRGTERKRSAPPLMAATTTGVPPATGLLNSYVHPAHGVDQSHLPIGQVLSALAGAAAMTASMLTASISVPTKGSTGIEPDSTGMDQAQERNKPGRKPLNDVPATKRTAQNRASQRAFRERRQAHLADLEARVQRYEAERTGIASQLAMLAQRVRDEAPRIHALERTLQARDAEIAQWRVRCTELNLALDAVQLAVRRPSSRPATSATSEHALFLPHHWPSVSSENSDRRTSNTSVMTTSTQPTSAISSTNQTPSPLPSMSEQALPLRYVRRSNDTKPRKLWAVYPDAPLITTPEQPQVPNATLRGPGPNECSGDPRSCNACSSDPDLAAFCDAVNEEEVPLNESNKGNKGKNALPRSLHAVQGTSVRPPSPEPQEHGQPSVPEAWRQLRSHPHFDSFTHDEQGGGLHLLADVVAGRHASPSPTANAGAPSSPSVRPIASGLPMTISRTVVPERRSSDVRGSLLSKERERTEQPEYNTNNKRRRMHVDLHGVRDALDLLDRGAHSARRSVTPPSPRS